MLQPVFMKKNNKITQKKPINNSYNEAANNLTTTGPRTFSFQKKRTRTTSKKDIKIHRCDF